MACYSRFHDVRILLLDGIVGTQPFLSRYSFTTTMEDNMLKGIALWAMGVPVFVIILLYMFVF